MVVANFDPPNAAYKSLGGNQLSFSVNVGVTTSVAGAPTPDAPTVNAIFSPVSDSDPNSINNQFFYGALNTPYMHTVYPTCTQQKFIFNESFANPFRVKASTIQREYSSGDNTRSETRAHHLRPPHHSPAALGAFGHDFQQRLRSQRRHGVGQPLWSRTVSATVTLNRHERQPN